MNEQLGDSLTDLYLQASSYAKNKLAQVEQAQTSADTMRWVYVGGAGIAAVVLIALLLRRS